MKTEKEVFQAMRPLIEKSNNKMCMVLNGVLFPVHRENAARAYIVSKSDKDFFDWMCANYPYLVLKNNI